MRTPIYRILASIIPAQAALMLGFAWFCTRPPNIPLTTPADHVVISKSRHTLALYAQGVLLRTYQVALGRSPGAKRFAGDHRTPEGSYIVDMKNQQSRFYLALHLSYPEASDRLGAGERPAGGDIEIHGQLPALAFLGSLQHKVDWTDGCIALTDAEMEEVFRVVRVGTPVDILP